MRSLANEDPKAEMGANRRYISGGHSQRLWPLLALLVVMVLVPTACVLWFMGRAIDNERAAVREKLQQVGRSQIASAQKEIQTWLDSLLGEMDRLDQQGVPACQVFMGLVVQGGQVASVIVYDSNGTSLYPYSPEFAGPVRSEEWESIERMEFMQADFVEAASAYANLAGKAPNVELKAQAMQAEARCLMKAGSTSRALSLLESLATDDAFEEAQDRRGNLIQPASKLWLTRLQLADHDASVVSQALVEALRTYHWPKMSSRQRLFLMRELESMNVGSFPTIKAEELAAQYLEESPPLPEVGIISKSSLPGIYCLANTKRTIVALFLEDGLGEQMQSHIGTLGTLEWADLRPIHPLSLWMKMRMRSLRRPLERPFPVGILRCS